MIFPIPVQMEHGNGTYTFKETSWEGKLLDFYNRTKDGNRDIAVLKKENLDVEEYEIEIGKNGTVISYSTEMGKYRALTSLRQLLKAGTEVPYVRIADKPQFERRAYMLDISRCRMPKVETLTWLIDILSDLKYNEIQLYMDSFCFKYEAFPEYTKDFDCLTAEDIEYLDQYCSERFIELVPNQNSFGHMEHWLAEKELAHLGLTDGKEAPNTLNPLLDESVEFMDQLYGSLLPHFKSEYVNIGLDEAYGLGKFQTEEACEKYGTENVFMDYLNKLSDLSEEKYGKHVMFWSDMIISHPKSHDRIPKNAIALNWGYDLIKSQMMERKCMSLEELGVPYYVCPGNCTWLSFTGRFDVMSFNVRTMGEIGRDHGAKGYLMTDWGCGEGHMHFLPWSLVPAALAAQYAWEPGTPQNGGTLKNHYIYAAENYMDENVFHAKVSRLLYRMQQYYLLEPERIHGGTMAGIMFRTPLSQTVYPFFFDLAKCGDNFYFDNVIEYMQKNIESIEKVEFEPRMKREILLNARMVILAEECMKVRMRQNVSAEKCRHLCQCIDEISAEYEELWLFRNFEKGMEDFLGQLADKKKELQMLCTDGCGLNGVSI